MSVVVPRAQAPQGVMEQMRAVPGLDVDHFAEECSTAIDALEIAAHLESAGVSNHVVRHAIDRPDVFALADDLYAAIPSRSGRDPTGKVLRRGAPRDLLRGAGFAIPTLLFIVAVEGLRLHPVWWMLPVTLIVGWALGQGATSVLYLLRDGDEPGAEAAVSGWLPIAAVAGTGVVAFAARGFMGGDVLDVAVATLLVAYMVGAGVLFTLREERLILRALVPGALAMAALPWHTTIILTRSAAGWAAVASITATVVLASRRLSSPVRAFARLGRSDVLTVARYMVAGGCSGAVVALIVVAGRQSGAPGGGGVFASLPLILSLGVMEWQFRTFRWRAASLATSCGDVAEFSARVWAAFGRALASYCLALGALSALDAAVAAAVYPTVPVMLLAAQAVLGVAYFTGLVVGSCSRVDLVLAAWAGSLASALCCVALGWIASGRVADSTLRMAAMTAAFVAAGCLVVVARRVVRTPLSY